MNNLELQLSVNSLDGQLPRVIPYSNPVVKLDEVLQSLSHPLNSFCQRTMHKNQLVLSIRCIYTACIPSWQWQLGACDYICVHSNIGQQNRSWDTRHAVYTVQSYNLVHQHDYITFSWCQDISVENYGQHLSKDSC